MEDCTVMFYFEPNQPHFFVWPALAVGIDSELWIGIGWLNVEIGIRFGDGGQFDFYGEEPKP